MNYHTTSKKPSWNRRNASISLSLLFLDGNSLSGETIKPSGENVAPSNHVVNKNRIPPGMFINHDAR